MFILPTRFNVSVIIYSIRKYYQNFIQENNLDMPKATTKSEEFRKLFSVGLLLFLTAKQYIRITNSQKPNSTNYFGFLYVF